MFQSLSQRTVIIGNSGAGKSALAESLATLVHVPVTDLDLLNEGDGYGRRRGENAARRMTLEVSARLLRSPFPGQRHSSGWIFHGAFAVPDCSHVIHAEEQRIRTPWSF
jgi:ABC-type molybdenum transport system ATPase subunit/photorepair protein PhrA